MCVDILSELWEQWYVMVSDLWAKYRRLCGHDGVLSVRCIALLTLLKLLKATLLLLLNHLEGASSC